MNADRDRDHQLDDILTRELRASKRALRQAGDEPATEACLDAETMAAWVDGGLDAHAVALAEAHASSCARCQALLGAVAQTTPAATIAEPRTAKLWRWWFAPLAATAAAVTVWMVVPQGRLTAPPAPTEMADLAEPKAEVAKQHAETAVTQSAPAAAQPEAKDRGLAGRERADAPAARAEAVAPKREAQALEARERPAELAKPADAAAEGRVAAAAPPAAPAVALLNQTDPRTDSNVTARSTPSANVIWLVGRAGLVQLATDGQTFTRLTFPEAVDLTAVTAIDERQATVTTVDGRRFQTADGGRTWTRP